jgi:hypothetical protein
MANKQCDKGEVRVWSQYLCLKVKREIGQNL